MVKRVSKKLGEREIDYVMQDVIPSEQMQKASMDSIKNKSGAGIGEKPLHKVLKKKLQETKSPLVADENKPIVDEALEKEEEDFYTSEDTGLVEESGRSPQSVQEEQVKKDTISRGFKDALMHFGPRLASLLVGGSEALEGYETGMAGFKQATEPDTADMDYQQVEELRDSQGRPLSYSKKTGKFYDVEGKETTAFTDPKMKQIQETQKTDLAKARADFKTKIVKEFNSTVKESAKAIGMAKSALSLINSNSKLAMPVAARAIARLAGEGTRMTDKDVEQFMGSQAVSDSLKRTYQRAIDGTMTEEDKKVMTDAINKMQEVETELVSSTKSDLAQRYGSIDENLATPEDIMDILTTKEETKAVEQKKKDDDLVNKYLNKINK